MSTTLRLLAALAMVALISAGCSNAATPTFTVTATSTNTPTQTFTRTPTVTITVTNTPAGTGTGSSGGSTTTTNRDQAVKFAECMRTNGIREFPDPNAAGDLTIDQIANGSSLDTSSAAFTQAISACRDLEPPGFTGVKRSPEQQKAALEFAQCIRDNGVKDFPDPAPAAPLVDTNLIPSTARNGGMSILQAAMHKCGDFARNAGVSGGQ